MNKGVKTCLWAAWIVLAAVAAYGLGERAVAGKELANYGSYVPWGLWVSTYIYFIGLSAGAFLLSSMVYVFGVKSLARVGRLALFTAAVTLGMALFSIWMDLGHMWRAYEVLTRPNFHSMMAWMVWLYTGYFLLILAELWFELRCDLATRAAAGGALAPLYRLLSLGWTCPTDAAELQACHQQSLRVLRRLGALGIPLAIAFHGGVGALFATLSARPYWHSGLFPILFLTGALVSGGALLLCLVSLLGAGGSEREQKELRVFLARLVLVLLVFDVILEWAEVSIPLWYGVGSEVGLWKEILFGHYGYVFWVFHLGLGVVVPLALLLKGQASRFATGLAGLLVATTFLAVRLNIVIPPQTEPHLRGLAEAYSDARLRFEYVPSLFEWAVVAAVVAAGMAVFWLGLRLLPLLNGEGPEEDAAQTVSSEPVAVAASSESAGDAAEREGSAEPSDPDAPPAIQASPA
ncbi:MAG: hypothetical protein D6731_25650 [Planctomycetota bacterium]|nr:MAG: hypothetical protein D6731_25650 [Planctomycetota bacterium]